MNTREYKVTTKILIKSSDKLLILKNSGNSDLIWDLPGGTLEKGEQITQCIKRELNEELGINIDVSNLTLFNNYVVNRTKKSDLVILVYTYNLEIDNITLSSEHCEYKYIAKNDLNTLNEDSIIFKIIGDYL